MRVASDPDECSETHKICLYHFYMIICLTEWFSKGEIFMFIAFPVFLNIVKSFSVTLSHLQGLSQ